MKSSDEKRIVVGRLIGAHGITGEMRLHPLTDYPERFSTMTTLTVELEGKASLNLDVVSLVPYEGKGVFLVRVSQVTDREGAEALKGYTVTISETERPQLDDDEYWIDDLIGLRILDGNTGDDLGELQDVLTTGSNDVYSILTPSGKTQMLPALGEVILSVDLHAKIMKVNVPEGLWD